VLKLELRYAFNIGLVLKYNITLKNIFDNLYIYVYNFDLVYVITMKSEALMLIVYLDL
jgi:hypothetical protein